MRPIVRHAAQIFPVMETRQITVVTANQLAFPGCDPYSFIVGSAIGLEQSGIIRPATVIDCKYDSANTRMLVTVTGRLSTSSSLCVWKQDGSDAYYMMNGGPNAVASFIPGGMAAGASPADSALGDLGFFNSQNRTLKKAGAPVYSADTTYLGGYPVKIVDQQALAQDATSGAGLGSAIATNRGMFLRTGIRVDNLGPNGMMLYFRNWNSGSGDYKTFYLAINANRTLAYGRQDYGSSGSNYGFNTAFTVPSLATWFDLALEMDSTNQKIRCWIGGTPQATFSATDMGYIGGPFCIGSWGGMNFNSYGGQMVQNASGGAPVYYLHDYLLLNYAPIMADGVILPVPTKPFSYPGLRAAY